MWRAVVAWEDGVRYQDSTSQRCAFPIGLQASTEARNGTMDTSEDHLLPRRDPFPQQLSEAAKALPRFSTAYAQFREGANSVNLHIEAPEIMKRFAGGVQFEEGRCSRFISYFVFYLDFSDPKGVLFYDSFSNISVTHFTVVYYQGVGSSKTVRVDFHVTHGPLHRKLVARVRIIARCCYGKLTTFRYPVSFLQGLIPR